MTYQTICVSDIFSANVSNRYKIIPENTNFDPYAKSDGPYHIRGRRKAYKKLFKSVNANLKPNREHNFSIYLLLRVQPRQHLTGTAVK